MLALATFEKGLQDYGKCFFQRSEFI